MNLFAPATIADTIKTEVALELAKVRQVDAMIEKLEFHKELSLSKVAAMLNWERDHYTITQERTEHDDHSSY